MELKNRLAGTWRLVSFLERRADGAETHTFGLSPHGLLMYDHGGSMSVQITRNDEPYGYFGYFGRYTVDADAETVTYYAEGGTDRAFAATDQRRLFTLQRDRLVLSTPPVDESDVTYIATWVRQP